MSGRDEATFLVRPNAGLPFAHLEAGLRSFNPRSAEEVNRRVAAATAQLHFAPTRAGLQQLATWLGGVGATVATLARLHAQIRHAISLRASAAAPPSRHGMSGCMTKRDGLGLVLVFGAVLGVLVLVAMAASLVPASHPTTPAS